jgi:hypothetical protein
MAKKKTGKKKGGADPFSFNFGFNRKPRKKSGGLRKGSQYGS